MNVTRILVLGILLDKSLTGYAVQAELVTWGAERWANVKYGSIYHALRKLHEEGLLRAAGPEDGTPQGTRYSITDDGRAAFAKDLRTLWFTHQPPKDPLQVALTFMDRMPKGELLGALHRRLALVEQDLRDLSLAQEAKLSAEGVPRHVAENLQLARLHDRAELEWLEEAIDKVTDGALP